MAEPRPLGADDTRRDLPGAPEVEDEAEQRELLGKMDALLRRHRPGAFGTAAGAAEDVPVLTEVAGAQEPADLDIPVLTDIVPAPGVQALSGMPAEDAVPAAEEAPPLSVAEAPPFSVEGALHEDEPADTSWPGFEEADALAAEALHESTMPLEALPAEAPFDDQVPDEEPELPAHDPSLPTLAQFEAMAEHVFHHAVRRLDGRIDEIIKERLHPRLWRLFEQSLDELLAEVRTDLKLMTRECVHAELRARLDALAGPPANAAPAADDTGDA